jgi:beta-glucosidase
MLLPKIKFSFPKILFAVSSVVFFAFYLNLNAESYSNSPLRSPATKQILFPSQFKWCVATAAHQIEGGNKNNDWWEWEHSIPSKIKNNDSSVIATDHWNRLDLDTNLMKELGVNQYRFSIEWSRIEPKEGEFDQVAMNHYRHEIDLLKQNGISPMITLHHFTSPIWFTHKGGWTNEKSPEQFLKFVYYVRTQLGESVSHWVTFNEPMVMLLGGYANGVFPPGIKDWKKVATPLKNILKAHSLAYYELHKNSNAQVGMAHHLRIFEPYSKLNPVDWYLASKFENAFNWTIPNSLYSGTIHVSVPTMIKVDEELPELKGTQDYFGLNYYSRDFIKYTPKGENIASIVLKEKADLTDLNWEIYPHGIFRILKKINQQYNELPIYITENGIADRNDSKRSDFIKNHLKEIYDAINSGIDVRGYCHWSLMDNFEWNEGYSARFGLYQMDYKTLERKPTNSARLYKDIIQKNGWTQE